MNGGSRVLMAEGDYSATPRKIYTGDFQVKEVYPGWRPHLVIENGIGNRLTDDVILGIWQDGTVIYVEAFTAKIEAPMQMRSFPFDRQQMEVFVHPFFYRRNEVVLTPFERFTATWTENLGIAQWVREGVTVSERPASLIELGLLP